MAEIMSTAKQQTQDRDRDDRHMSEKEVRNSGGTDTVGRGMKRELEHSRLCPVEF